jgi:hypothetical protein
MARLGRTLLLWGQFVAPIGQGVIIELGWRLSGADGYERLDGAHRGCRDFERLYGGT